MKKLLLMTMMLVAMSATAQKPIEMNLWPEGPKTSNNDPKDMAKVWVYLPNEKKATGRAVVCCPGGGRLVRRNAKEWHINTKDVGIMGFSAGGHLASTIATHATGDAMPNFQILFYPVISMEQGVTHQGSRDNLLGKKPKRKLVNEYCNEQHIGHHTPRAFLALAHDDKAVPPVNSLNYYEELYTNKVPASMHIYPSGGHGFGIRQSFAYHLEMMLELKAWLSSF